MAARKKTAKKTAKKAPKRTARKAATKKPAKADSASSRGPVSRTSAKKSAKRGRVGRPPFAPTEEQRRLVSILTGMGQSQEDTAAVIINPTTGKRITVETLQRYFTDELETGAAQVKASLRSSLLKKAAGNGPQAVTAGIWLSKMILGWRESVSVEADVKSGVLVAAAGMSADDWIAAAQERTADKKEPGGG